MELRRLLLLQFFVNEPYIFDRMRALDKEMYGANKQRMDTNYFVKVVPYIFANAISDEEHWAYSYSLNHQQKATPVHEPKIQVSYEFSPITMRVTKNYKRIGPTVVNMCAIVGGVFIMFGVLNRTVSSIVLFMQGLTKND